MTIVVMTNHTPHQPALPSRFLRACALSPALFTASMVHAALPAESDQADIRLQFVEVDRHEILDREQSSEFTDLPDLPIISPLINSARFQREEAELINLVAARSADGNG